MRDGLAALRMGGRMSMLGLPTEPFELDWNRLVIFKGITLHGIIGRRMYDTWYQMDQLMTLRPARHAPGDHARHAHGTVR